MSDQQPHVEVFSRNKLNRSPVLVAPVTIFSLAGSFLLVYALWQFLWWIAIGVLSLLAVGACYLVVRLGIDIYERWLHAPYIHVSEQNGMFNTKAGRMYPLALPAPVITEVTTEDEALKRSRILDLRARGRTLQEIVDETNIPYNQVQKICAAATNLVIKK